MIDLRSDTVTKPTAAMYQAMRDAELGDEIYGGDPTVERLQEYAAELFGFEAALFVPSGTQANLIALLVHCPRGSEFISGEGYHIYRLEGGGGAALAGASACALSTSADGTLDMAAVKAMIKPDDLHFPKTRLLCLENTYNGYTHSPSYIESAAQLCRESNLALHLDGARIFNAAAALEVPVATLTTPADSLSACLSKGLCAPAGAMLCGSSTFIDKSRYWRKTLGGCMRQTGILAACGLIALMDMTERLTDDHARAKRLALQLATIDEMNIDPVSVTTNMVFANTDDTVNAEVLKHDLAGKGIRVSGHDSQIRMVTHRDISDADIECTITAFKSFFS